MKKLDIYGIIPSVVPKRPTAILVPYVYLRIVPSTESKLYLTGKVLERPIRSLYQAAMSNKKHPALKAHQQPAGFFGLRRRCLEGHHVLRHQRWPSNLAQICPRLA